jgi:hypothetical protein
MPVDSKQLAWTQGLEIATSCHQPEKISDQYYMADEEG